MPPLEVLHQFPMLGALHLILPRAVQLARAYEDCARVTVTRVCPLQQLVKFFRPEVGRVADDAAPCKENHLAKTVAHCVVVEGSKCVVTAHVAAYVHQRHPADCVVDRFTHASLGSVVVFSGIFEAERGGFALPFGGIDPLLGPLSCLRRCTKDSFVYCMECKS